MMPITVWDFFSVFFWVCIAFDMCETVKENLFFF
jgi:hypothetical protein